MEHYLNDVVVKKLIIVLYFKVPEISILGLDLILKYSSIIIFLFPVKGHPHLAILPAILLATVLLTHPHSASFQQHVRKLREIQASTHSKFGIKIKQKEILRPFIFPILLGVDGMLLAINC